MFKKVHELLYELERRKTEEIGTLLTDVFGFRVNTEELQMLLGLGQKHQERMQQMMQKNKFVHIAKEH